VQAIVNSDGRVLASGEAVWQYAPDPPKPGRKTNDKGGATTERQRKGNNDDFRMLVGILGAGSEVYEAFKTSGGKNTDRHAIEERATGANHPF
jgi:hypothetical protein